MKKTISKFLLGTLVAVSSLSSVFAVDEVVNLSIQNMNIYYDGYDPATKKITGIHFAVGAELETSTQNTSVPFKVVLMLLPEGSEDVNTGIVVWSDNVAGGKLHQGGSWEYDDLIVDLNTVSNIQTGNYNLVAFAEGYFAAGAYFDKTDIIHLTAGPQPDLDITSMSLNFDKVMGNVSNIIVKIHNGGTELAGESNLKLTFVVTMGDLEIKDSINLSVPQIDTDHTLDFTPGDISLSELFGGYEQGATIQMVATVDPLKVVSESNETNNGYVVEDLTTITGIEAPLAELGIVVSNPISKNSLSALENNNMIRSINIYSFNGEKCTINSMKDGLNLLEINTIKGTEVLKIIVE